MAAVAWTGPRVYTQSAALPIVPGAQGFGTSTRAAYACGTAPAVLRVTNLNDSGTGSFRTALLTAGPRVIIFETSGTIVFSSDVNVMESCLTVAGQTAPSPGITIRNGGLNFYAHDVLVQHIRIRPGDGGVLQPQTAGHDASIVYDCAGCPTQYAPHDIVFDHVSLSWTGGKLANADARSPNSNITYWRCIFGEALYRAANVIISPGQPSSLALPIVDHTAQVSVIQNLFAHNSDRNPEIHGGTVTHFLNNIVYDWGRDENAYPWASFFYGVEADPWRADFVGNVYIAGGSPHPFAPLYAIGTWAGDTGSQLYMSDNAIDQTKAPVSAYFNYMSVDPRVGTPPVSLTGMTVMSASSTKAFVLANAGARPLDRDAVDTRIVNDVTNYTGTVISSQTQVGGWPILAVNARALTLPANPNTAASSGYTNLEVWLQGLAAAVEKASAPPSAPAAPTGLHIVG
jgi:hypothetical protein